MRSGGEDLERERWGSGQMGFGGAVGAPTELVARAQWDYRHVAFALRREAPRGSGCDGRDLAAAGAATRCGAPHFSPVCHHASVSLSLSLSGDEARLLRYV